MELGAVYKGFVWAALSTLLGLTEGKSEPYYAYQNCVLVFCAVF
jgi:hypothetical protein